MIKKILAQFLFWILALVITLASAVYQRKTGPTHPIDGVAHLNGNQIKFSLRRSHPGSDDHPVTITVVDTAVAGVVVWRRYPTNDDWSRISMQRNGEELTAYLPNQPAAGKLEYHVELIAANEQVFLPEENNAIIRYTGVVPNWALLPHILFMFTSMLLATRTALSALRKNGKVVTLAVLTTVFLVLGGFIFGPIVQKFAFGDYWTGFPFGTDLTDNKTLIALIGWIAALIAIRKAAKPKPWVLAASVIMMAVFLVPHSMLGSQLDYSTLESETIN